MDLILDPSTAGSLYTHAERAAQMLDLAVARKRHYFAVLDELQAAGALPEMPGVVQGWHAAKEEQLAATAHDLHALAAAAAEQRADPTRPLPTLIASNDKPMPIPDPKDPVAVTATFLAMNNLLAGALRDAADCMDSLVPWMRRGKVSSDVRVLATDVQELANMIRPQAPPGPYSQPS